MYDQLPMHVSLMERKRERDALLREKDVLRALGEDPAPSARLIGWLAAGAGRLAAATRRRAPQSVVGRRQNQLGSSTAT